MDKVIDCLIVGGGINGTGIAADAAGRGLSVLLCEQNDLASATSSASSKLIHGGLRYLEHYEFRLVRQSLQERERLLKIAPHLISPLKFYMPYTSSQRRPAWLLRFGLFIYDRLAGASQLPRSRYVKMNGSLAGHPLKNCKTAFSYYDCRTDDARLVIHNAIAAQDHGAQIRTHCRLLSAQRTSDHWQVELDCKQQGKLSVQARCIINAAGPWVDEVNQKLGLEQTQRVRLVKGSHIVVDKLYEGEHAYIIQNHDDRIIFVIPYHGFTMIGTTDVDHAGNAEYVTISDEEIQYLCNCVNDYFKQSINAEDVLDHWSGLRALLDEPATTKSAPARATRDYLIELDNTDEQAPLISVYGGKITTYRKLAETVMSQLATTFPQMGPAWTAKYPLPGSDMPSLSHYTKKLSQRFPWLEDAWLARYVHSYGTLSEHMLSGVKNMDDMGIHFGFGLFQREVEYLLEHEWAKTADDILYRRSKLGLHFSPEEKINLESWLSYR